MKILYRRILSLIISVSFIFVFCFLGFFKNINAESDKSKTINVSNLQELKRALDDELCDRVVVTNTITLKNNEILDLNGKIVSVVATYLDDNGFVRDEGYSEYNVFTINKGITVSIKNGTIEGGYVNSKSGGINNYGTLTLEHVNFTKGYSGIFSTSTSITVCKECNFYRNAKSCGGGLVCDGGKIVIDCCSFYDNRSLFSNRGGGAIEISNNSCAYVNNTVIANNTSAEIGGAINVRTKSKLYIMNSTISGNVTTNKIHFGGGIGNNDGRIYGVNTLFVNNFCDNRKELIPSDVGLYSGQEVNLYGCLYGAILDTSGEASDKIRTNTQNYVSTERLMANYRCDSSFSMTSNYTTPYDKPVLVSKDNDKLALYVPCAPDTIVANGSKYDTYFDYSDLTNIKMGYSLKGDSNISSIGTLDAPSTNSKVSKLFEGVERKNEIGASGSIERKFCTTKIKEKIRIQGTTTGATTYGDSYEYGTVVALSAKPNDGYHFKQWDVTLSSGDNYSVESNPYSVTLTEDVTVLPIFEVGNMYSVKFISETCSSNGEPYVIQGNDYTTTIVPNSMYEFSSNPTVKIGERMFECDKDYSFEISENKGILIIPSDIIDSDIEIIIECKSMKNIKLNRAKKLNSTPKVYDLSVEWGDMVFVYDKGYWTGTETVRSTNVAGPEPNHEDTECGIWYGMDNTNNKIVIKNMSNVPITVAASVYKVESPEKFENVRLNLIGGQGEMWTEEIPDTLESTLSAKVNDSDVVDIRNLFLNISGPPGNNVTSDKCGEKIGDISITFGEVTV